MQRFITEKLIGWKNSKDRKPLIIKGARQVGKTYILKEFGEKKTMKMLLILILIMMMDWLNYFLNTKDPNRIIEQLSLANGKKN